MDTGTLNVEDLYIIRHGEKTPANEMIFIGIWNNMSTVTDSTDDCVVSKFSVDPQNESQVAELVNFINEDDVEKVLALEVGGVYEPDTQHPVAYIRLR